MFNEPFDQPVQVSHSGVELHTPVVKLSAGLDLLKEPFAHGIQFGFTQFGGRGEIFFDRLALDDFPGLSVT
jgi:hypothetical protein